MEVHKGYRIAKRLIEAGDIKDIRSVFEVLPGTVVARDLGVQYMRLLAMVDNVEDFRLRELYLLAQLIGIEGRVLILLADTQREVDKKKRKKYQRKSLLR